MTGEEGPVTIALREVLEHAREVDHGELADHIPELTQADPAHLGIALVSAQGHCYEAGDSAQHFTIQSIAKAFVYAVALSDHGLEEVHRYVGYEPSGDPFDAISLDEDGRPANPMINAGAIVTTGLVGEGGVDERFGRIRGRLSQFAGRPLELDEEVLASERRTGHRNRALAHLVTAADLLAGEVDEVVEVYFRQGCLRVTARDLAVMGATLANGGTNPVTGETVVSSECARHTLALMTTCGMYDHSGEWALRVGMPAKSGVGGGIVAVKPGQFGVGVYSPPLDEAGNSTRGVAALQVLADDYGLHLLRHPVEPVDPVAGTREDDGGLVLELRGEIDFVAAEQVVHALEEHLADAGGGDVTIDLHDATEVSRVARRLLERAADRASDAGRSFTTHDPSDLLT